MVELSPYLLAPVITWLIAQGIKFILDTTRTRKFTIKFWYISGNMPSAHTATVVSLMTIIGAIEGVSSGLFALSAVFAAVTAYDSMIARRASGEQGLALQKLLGISSFSKDPLPYHALGHRPLEVAAGALLGLIVGLIVAIFAS